MTQYPWVNNIYTIDKILPYIDNIDKRHQDSDRANQPNFCYRLITAPRAPARRTHTNLARRLSQFVHPCAHFVPKVYSIDKIVTGRVDESRNNNTAKVEHETVRQTHYRHIARGPSGRAQESHDFVFPGVTG